MNKLASTMGLAFLLAIASGCTDNSHVTAPVESDASPESATWHFAFSEVRAYRINWDDELTRRCLVEKDGKTLNPTRLPESGVLLTNEQVAHLRDAVCGTHPSYEIAFCFHPHHAFLFTNDQNEIVGSIDVCFICDNVTGKPGGYADTDAWDLDSIEQLLGELGIPIKNPEWTIYK